MKSFGSDNHSGIHPQIIAAIESANKDHVPAYGEDFYTAQFEARMKELFGDKSLSYLVFNGTGANITGLSPLVGKYQSIICATTAHINVDECGAPEANLGCKLTTVSTKDGKLTPSLIEPFLTGFGVQHHSQPKVISISQPTELGTLYTVEEIKALADAAHSRGMFLHMDGARFANAVAAMGVSAREITTDAGVDVLSFGGTKNGMMIGEAVVYMNGNLAPDFVFHRKKSMQLSSKMRFIAAQFLAYLKNDLWIELAIHSNKMAQILAEKLSDVECVNINQKVETNAIFATMPENAAVELRESYYFYVWDESCGELRWMCSWDTSEDDISQFAECCRKISERNI